MSLSNTTKYLWCLLVLQTIGFLDSIEAINVPISQQPHQPQKPKTVEAQAKFFQDFFSVQLSPHMLEFGHVCEDPNNWEQRYEHKDYKNHRDMGKVRWGDKQGGYGEHYWDLNHAGHGANNDGDNNDDGSYDPRTEDESYDKYNKDQFHEPNEPQPNYETEDDYKDDKSESSQFDQLGRRKRAQPRIKYRRQPNYDEQNYAEQKSRKSKGKRIPQEILQADNTQTIEVTDEDEEDNDTGSEEIEEIDDEEPITVKPVRKNKKLKKKEKQEEIQDSRQEKQVQEQTKHQNQQTQQYTPAQYMTPQEYAAQTLPEANQQYVPYENGAGVRQHYQTENLAPTVPRLFLEPSTGHVVDRATGQAYVLQPILTGAY